MRELTLSTKDICKIITTCSKCGVSEITFGDLTLNFHAPARAMNDSIPAAAIPREAIENVSSDLSDSEKEMDEKERTALLVLEDPLELERRIGNGELVDEDSGD